MKREFPDSSGREGTAAGKGKMPAMSPEEDVDELLAALGYKVRSSDMADVAQKLEQLEMAMGFGNGVNGGVNGGEGAAVGMSDDMGFFSDTVHYNPSDLSTWLDSMLTELNTPVAPPAPLAPPVRHSVVSSFDPAESSSVTFDPNPVSPDPSRERKRMRTGSGSGSCSSSSSSSLSRGGAVTEPVNPVAAAAGPVVNPIVVVDPQEAGIRLVHALMACAEAVQQDNLKAADALVKQISILASSQGGAMRKVATYFGEALARRIYRVRPSVGPASDSSTFDSSFGDLLHMHFYETCPYLKFAHFTANQAILEAFAGCKRVHVVDFGIKQGMQWPALLQALALRPGGPPAFRLTGVGPDQPENSDSLHQVGMKLAQFAHTIRIDFKYRGLVANSLADLKPYMLEEENSSEPPEAVAVNSVCELHQLLARSGELDKVFETIHKLKPKIITIVEQEANHNTGSFLDRFTESLHYYSTMFDSIESSVSSPAGDPANSDDQNQLMSELYLGRQICNIVSTEGSDRTERHENLLSWRARFNQAGFDSVHLGSNAFKQASTLLALFAGGDGYRVEEKDGCLTLGWHTRPLIATSAWRIATSA